MAVVKRSRQRKAFNIEAAKGFGGEIEGNVTFFYGKCPKCVTKKK